MNRSILVVTGVVAAALLLAGCSTQPTVAHTLHPSRAPGAPTLSAVSAMHLTLNSTPVSADLQGTGAFEISLTTAQGRAVAAKVLGWLRRAKPLRMTTIPLPSLGDHMLTISLRKGKTVSVAQYFAQDTAGSYHASPGVVLISTPPSAAKSSRYRDPGLARWLNAGWSADIEKLAPHWICKNKRPPSPYQNEARGVFQNGTQWIVAADSAQECAVLYTGKGATWKTTLIATHTFSSPLSGAFVEQAQFLDPMHGFVLISGTPYHGQTPRILYATLDGGVTWHSLPVDSEQPFPYGSSMVNMRFTSSSVGWLVTLNNYSGRVYVYHTVSGGETWTETSFSLPAGTRLDPSRIALAPAFRNTQDGTIEVVSQWKGLLIFDTPDGGGHWIYNPLGNG